MRADELTRRLISGELTNYSVVRTSPEPLQYRKTTSDFETLWKKPSSKWSRPWPSSRNSDPRIVGTRQITRPLLRKKEEIGTSRTIKFSYFRRKQIESQSGEQGPSLHGTSKASGRPDTHFVRHHPCRDEHSNTLSPTLCGHDQWLQYLHRTSATLSSFYVPLKPVEHAVKLHAGW
jgi:hypothetical protein